MFGLTVQEASAPPVEVWPDNATSVNTFVACITQWRAGPSGIIGLDYNALPVVLRLTAVKRADWPIVFDDIRTMEAAVLDLVRRKQAA